MLAQQVKAAVPNPYVASDLPSGQKVLSVNVLQGLLGHFCFKELADEDGQLYVLELVHAHAQGVLETISEDEEGNGVLIPLLA